MKNQKKLVIFMPSIEGGGVEKNLFIISNYLSTKLKNVILITSNNKHNKLFKKIKIINPKYNIWSNFGRIIKYIVCLLLLIKLIIKDKNLIIFSFQANLYCAIICKIFNKKIIIRSNSSPSGWSKNILKKIIYKLLLKIPNKIIVNSFEFKKEFKKKFNVNSVCIYNPLNKKEILYKSRKKIYLPFFKKNKKELKIINIARFTDQKDHITLLRAINLIKDKINFKMLIIGRGVNKKNMINYINKNNLKKNVKIINFQKNPYKFIASSDLFILASKFEGLPNVLLESIVLKKFIISSNCPTGPKEILQNGKGGELFSVGNYNELSKKIIFFHKNKKKMIKKINYSYKLLHKFDYYVNLKKYLNVINNIIIS